MQKNKKMLDFYIFFSYIISVDKIGDFMKTLEVKTFLAKGLPEKKEVYQVPNEVYSYVTNLIRQVTALKMQVITLKEQINDLKLKGGNTNGRTRELQRDATSRQNAINQRLSNESGISVSHDKSKSNTGKSKAKTDK
jgi:hypothetical protein